VTRIDTAEKVLEACCKSAKYSGSESSVTQLSHDLKRNCSAWMNFFGFSIEPQKSLFIVVSKASNSEMTF
jgi:hypothetical protein